MTTEGFAQILLIWFTKLDARISNVDKAPLGKKKDPPGIKLVRTLIF